MLRWRSERPDDRTQINKQRATGEYHVESELEPHLRSRRRSGPEAAAFERKASKQRG